MIEFDETEMKKSVLSDDCLRIVALFVDREVYDKLLYNGRKWYNVDGDSQAR